MDFDEARNSENDNPIMFGEDQQFIVFEYANGGTDMEHYTFRNAAQVRMKGILQMTSYKINDVIS